MGLFVPSAWAAGPTITSASVTPNPDTVGNPIEFDVGWTDPGATVHAVICQTNAISASGTCPGGAWVVGAIATTTSPAQAYLTPYQVLLGTNTYYAFACDSANACSSSMAGTFTVANRAPVLTAASATSPVGPADAVTFSASWEDVSDTETILFCKTNSLTGTACTDGAWASASGATTSPTTATYTTSTADIGSHAFSAFACDSAGACTSSISGSFTVWGVSLAVSTQLPTLGSSVTVTATAQGGATGSHMIQIYDMTTGTRIAGCQTGTVCSGTDSHPTTSEVQSGNPVLLHVYRAYIAAPSTPPPTDEIYAQSSDIAVEWGAALTFAVTAVPNQQTTGSSVTVQATSNRTPGDVGLAIELFDQTTGALLAGCDSGTSCSASFTRTTEGTETFVGYIMAPSTTQPTAWESTSSASATWTTPPPPPPPPTTTTTTLPPPPTTTTTTLPTITTTTTLPG